MRLKILSYNIHKGFTSWSRDYVLAQIRTALRETDADIMFLQEVHGHRDGMSDNETSVQFEYLADSVWDHYAYGKNAIYSQGHHGNAILSKFPITEWANETISNGRAETRGLLRAKIYVEEFDQHLLLVNTHLDLTQKGRNEQTKKIISLLSEHNAESWIMVGDFNDWNKKISPLIETELKAQEVFKSIHGKFPATFPSFLPFLSLDRVFIKGLKAVRAEALFNATWKKLSDHIPLLVELDLPLPLGDAP